MAKVFVPTRYDELVVDAADALKLADIYARAEKVKRIYSNGAYQWFIFPQDEKTYPFEVLPESIYALGKMAGKPENE